jgi:hypothetical protein
MMRLIHETVNTRRNSTIQNNIVQDKTVSERDRKIIFLYSYLNLYFCIFFIVVLRTKGCHVV